MIKRFDPHANHPKFQKVFSKLTEKYKVSPLGDISEYIFSGITPKAGGDAYTENNGVWFIKSGSLSYDGTLSIDDTSQIKTSVHNGLMKSSQLKKGDILIAIVGATIGKVALYAYDNEANINQAIAAVRLKQGILPEFIIAYLLSDIGQTYLEFLKRPVARANINLQEIAEIGVPILTHEQQISFVNLFNEERKRKNAKLQQADEILAGISLYIHSALNIGEMSNAKPSLFAVFGKSISGKSIAPEYHNPFYTRRVAEICKCPHDTLGNIVDFSSEMWNQKDYFNSVFPYIEISNVYLKENKYKVTEINVSDAPSRARMIVRNGDIIVSTTRPHRGAVATIQCTDDEIQIASTGFCILRSIRRDDVLKEYLQWILLDDYVLLQMLQRSSGGNYPAITSDELKNVIIPIPSIADQIAICKEAKKRQTQAFALRQEAEQEWAAAKAQFEKELLGE